jgi:hypothetical protein
LLSFDLYGGHDYHRLLAQAFASNRSLETLSLRCLYADSVTDLILSHLGAHSTLRCLKLNSGLLSHWIASLTQLVATTSTLLELHLDNYKFEGLDPERVQVRALCRALCQSASLCRVDLRHDVGRFQATSQPAFSETELRLVNASGKRNRHLVELLAYADPTDLALFPSLFCVARRAPRTVLNNVLIGLLVHGEHQSAAEPF